MKRGPYAVKSTLPRPCQRAGDRWDSGCLFLAIVLRRARTRFGFTQVQLASAAGVTRASLSHWERAARAIRRHDFDRLADLLPELNDWRQAVEAYGWLEPGAELVRVSHRRQMLRWCRRERA